MRPLLVILILIGAYAMYRLAAPGTVSEDDMMSALVLLGWLAFVLLGFRAGPGQGAGTLVKYAVIWTGIFGLVFSLFSFQEEFHSLGKRLFSNLAPATPMKGDTGEVVLLRASDGQFHARGQANDTAVVFLVDTGASEIVLPYRAADAVGIDTGHLHFNVTVSTANGRAFNARAELDRLKVGDIVMYDIPVFIAKEGALDQPLLGMTFLNRLESYTFKGETLTLRQ